MNFITYTGGRNSGGDRPRAPDWMYKALRSWAPSYRFEYGRLTAKFQNVTFWRKTGEWAAIYVINTKGPRGPITEKFVWTVRDGQFKEVGQYGIGGTPWRPFAG